MSLQKPVNDGGGGRRSSPLIQLMTASLLALIPSIPSDAQTLTQVKKVYVERFEEGDEAEPLRLSLIKRLVKSGRYQVVDMPQSAEATVKGSGEIWLKGTCPSTYEPRQAIGSPSTAAISPSNC